MLNTKFSKRGNQYRTVLENKEQRRKLTLEIYVDIPIGSKNGNMICVYTPSSHAQLHFCSGFVASDVLAEVTFIGGHGGYISGIIVEKDAAFSNYCNIDADLLSEDFFLSLRTITNMKSVRKLSF